MLYNGAVVLHTDNDEFVVWRSAAKNGTVDETNEDARDGEDHVKKEAADDDGGNDDDDDDSESDSGDDENEFAGCTVIGCATPG